MIQFSFPVRAYRASVFLGLELRFSRVLNYFVFFVGLVFAVKRRLQLLQTRILRLPMVTVWR
jgi:hypothetical protein